MTADDPFPFARLLPSLASLDQSVIDLIVPMLKSVDLEKGEFFIQIGEEVTEVAVVDKGLLCRYNYYDMDHKFIDQFLFDNHFFTDREGYFSHQKSFTSIQAITPCHLWTIPIVKIEPLKKINPQVIPVIDEIIMETLNRGVNLRNMLRIKDPLQRIHRFYDLHPHYWPLILKEDIQCYLDISHTTYYRIQNKHG